MEKRTPHSSLAEVKSLVSQGKVRTTQAARIGASELGLELSDVLAVVMALKRHEYRKSMTTHADHRIWQDVYCPDTCMGAVYLKLTVTDDLLIVSFKEL